MEIKIESKIGTMLRSSEQIYEFLSDFNHLSSFVPPDKVQDWQASTDECSFEVPSAGRLTFRVVRRDPSHTIKMAVDTQHAKEVYLWIQLKEVHPYETKVKLTLKAEINPVMKMFITKPLQNFLDKIVDALSAM